MNSVKEKTLKTEPRLDHVAKHRVAQFRFKPSAFRRHYSVCVRNRHQVFDAGGEHGKGTGEFSRVDDFLQLGCSPDSADEMNSSAGARVINAEKRSEHIFLQKRDIELFHGVGCRSKLRAEVQGAPF